ncbi:MAG: GTP-binding protein [Candidatus Heimdallarchaeota archaeon]|nr:GTP-binding protein [Candidatus Heimdallarchaeota archaeon]MCK5047769.1 GTP-binding protein [Candidatus Heimdallarchaeota archaeon]
MSNESYLFKIVLLGEGAVGKTSLRKRYMGEGFEQAYSITIGSDFSIANKVIDGYKVIFQIWDLSGQPSFKIVRTGFYMGTHAALIVFDLANKHSFDEMENWINELYQHGTRGKVPIVIVGNKNDLIPQVSEESIEQFLAICASLSDTPVKLHYLETSALTGENVETVFDVLGRFFFEKYC